MEAISPNSKYHLPWRGIPLELRKTILEMSLNVSSVGAIYQGTFTQVDSEDEDEDDEYADVEEPYDSDEKAECLPEVDLQAYLVKPIRQRINTSILLLDREAYRIAASALYRKIRLNRGCDESMEFLEDLPSELQTQIKVISLGDQTVWYDDAPNRCFDELCGFLTNFLHLDQIELPVFERDYYITGWYYKLAIAVWEARLPQLDLRYEAEDIRGVTHVDYQSKCLRSI